MHFFSSGCVRQSCSLPLVHCWNPAALESANATLLSFSTVLRSLFESLAAAESISPSAAGNRFLRSARLSSPEGSRPAPGRRRTCSSDGSSSLGSAPGCQASDRQSIAKLRTAWRSSHSVSASWPSTSPALAASARPFRPQRPAAHKFG